MTNWLRGGFLAGRYPIASFVAGLGSLVALDNGVGGIDETQGTGIQGIRRRVAALDGHTTIDCPVGGPTTITVEVPCRP